MAKNEIGIPKLRFPGFTSTWEQRKLKDLSTYIRGSFPQPYTNQSFYDEENGKPFVQVADIGFDLKLNSDTKAHISKLAEPKSRFVKAGKVVVALQGSIEKSIGRTAITQYDAYFDRTILIFQNYKVPIDKQYFAQVIKKLFEREKERAWGATISTITKEHLNDFIIGIPNFEEQQKIGTFFKQLDNTIALHQRKLEHLQDRKKGLLQKMFPKDGEKFPELRFPGFTDVWEQRKLSEIATMNARIGWQNLRTSEFLDFGDYMLITGTDFEDGTINYSNIHYVEKARYDQDKKIQIQNDSILITKDGTLGKVAYVEGLTMPATLNAGVFNLRVKEDIEVDSRYLFHYLKAPFLLKYADAQSTGGTIKHLNQNVLVKFPIPLPKKEEQQKISSFFKQIDNTIVLHQRKLEHLKDQKKALLQQMFV